MTQENFRTQAKHVYIPPEFIDAVHRNLSYVPPAPNTPEQRLRDPESAAKTQISSREIYQSPKAKLDEIEAEITKLNMRNIEIDSELATQHAGRSNPTRFSTEKNPFADTKHTQPGRSSAAVRPVYVPTVDSLDIQNNDNSKNVTFENMIVGWYRRHPRLTKIGAGIALVALTPSIANAIDRDEPREITAAAEPGVMRIEGAAGITTVVQGGKELIRVESKDTGLKGSFGANAHMRLNITHENVPKFATITVTDTKKVKDQSTGEESEQPTKKRVEIDPSAATIEYEFEEQKAWDPKDDAERPKNYYHFPFATPKQTKEGEPESPFIENDDNPVSAEEDARIKNYVFVKDVPTEANMDFILNARLAVVNEIINTNACQSEIGKLNQSFNAMITDVYKDLGESEGVSYDVVFKDTKYASKFDELNDRVREGEDKHATFQAEEAKKASCELKDPPEMSNESRQMITEHSK